MSVEQQQRTVNNLDKEIADLQKKKAAYDKKAADEQKRATNVSISNNASASTIKSKMREIERHTEAANKAFQESATLQGKIADKVKKRSDAYLKLQSEQQSELKKQEKEQKRTLTNIQKAYEDRIAELERQRTPSFITTPDEENTITPEYDVFISHAWEDKESFADDFVEELKKLEIKVWYDTSEIKWGDSMRKRIDDGLLHSKFGVAILSPHYIAEGKYWTKTEFDGLFQLESINGKTLLPIWHNLTKQMVMDFSPIVANKKAMTTANMTAAEIAIELFKLLHDKENA